MNTENNEAGEGIGYERSGRGHGEDMSTDLTDTHGFGTRKRSERINPKLASKGESEAESKVGGCYLDFMG